MSSPGAARVEQQVVKIPEDEIAVALGRPEAALVCSVNPEKDLAIHQQRKKPDPGKAVLAPQLPDLLRFSQPGYEASDLRIANLEQCARPRRFQNQIIAAAPHVREPGQHHNIAVAQLR